MSVCFRPQGAVRVQLKLAQLQRGQPANLMRDSFVLYIQSQAFHKNAVCLAVLCCSVSALEICDYISDNMVSYSLPSLSLPSESSEVALSPYVWPRGLGSQEGFPDFSHIIAACTNTQVVIPFGKVICSRRVNFQNSFHLCPNRWCEFSLSFSQSAHFEESMILRCTSRS